MILKKPSENNLYDSLLSSPSENDTSQQLERPVTESYVNHSEKYLLGNSKNSSRQYYEMYTARLAIMRSTVEEKIKLRWGMLFFWFWKKEMHLKKIYFKTTDNKELWIR